jgi:hypothetical protein
MQPPNKEEAWVDPTWERLEDQIGKETARFGTFRAVPANAEFPCVTSVLLYHPVP